MEHIIHVDNVQDMKKGDFSAGNLAITHKYYSDQDDGGAEYEIVASKTIDDGGSSITLDNGLQAKLLRQGTVSVKQFGARGDGTTDDSKAIQAAVNAGSHIVFPTGTYICYDVSIPSFRILEGVGDVILRHPQNTEANNYHKYHILRSKCFNTTGSIISIGGRQFLEVEDTTGFEVGAVCTILGAAGGFTSQSTYLAKSIGEFKEGDTKIQVADPGGFGGKGTLLIGSEFGNTLAL